MEIVTLQFSNLEIV